MNHLLAQSISIKENFPPAKRFLTAGQLAGDAITIIASIAGVVAFIIIIVSGIRMITAAGDPKKLEGARSGVFFALIGLAVIALAFVILKVVQYILKSNIPITR